MKNMLCFRWSESTHAHFFTSFFTGSGKTYTFFGPDGLLTNTTSQSASIGPRSHHGVVLRTCRELLQAKEYLATNGIIVSFTAQFVEIYEEKVTDLLTGSLAQISRETGNIKRAVEAPFNTMDQIMETLRSGHERKKFASTEMNERSSRAHTALIIHVLQKLDLDKFSTLRAQSSAAAGLCAALFKNSTNDGVDDKLIKSQLHLIDLAGSERVKKSKASGLRLREAVGINSSLLVSNTSKHIQSHVLLS